VKLTVGGHWRPSSFVRLNHAKHNEFITQAREGPEGGGVGDFVVKSRGGGTRRVKYLVIEYILF